MPTFVPLGGDLAGNLVAGLVGNNIVDAFAVADANSQTGKLLRHLIGPAFDEFKSLADMNAVAASATAMNAVAASATAMNAVAASATARNAIRNSSTAWNIVAGSNMAIGKFVAGEAGLNPANYADMNAVAASSTAMQAVAASSTAMQAVAASATARSVALRSNYATTIWDTPNSSYIFTVGGSKTPETTGKTSDFSIVSGRLTNGKAQKVAAAGPSSQSSAARWSITLDLTGVTKIGIYTQATAANNQYVYIAVELDGTTLYAGNNQPSGWTYREFSVNVSGIHTLTLKGWNTYDAIVHGGIFTEIYLR